MDQQRQPQQQSTQTANANQSTTDSPANNTAALEHQPGLHLLQTELD